MGKPKKGKKSKKTPKEKKGRKGKKSKSKETLKPVIVKPRYLFETEQPVGAAHLTYELFPKKFRYDVIVICWGAVAQDGINTFKTRIHDNLVWVPVHIQHYTTNYSTEELMVLKSHTISFDINTNSDKLKKTLKALQKGVKSFYFIDEEVDSDKFVEVYLEDPNPYQIKESQMLEKYIKDIIRKCINYPLAGETVSWIQSFDSAHEYRIYDIITRICVGKDFEAKSNPIYYVEPAAEKKGKAKKGKTGKKDKKKTGKKSEKIDPNIHIKVSGESFFTYPTLDIYQQIRPELSIAQSYLLLSVDGLLTLAQKFELSPLVLKVQKIEHLPVQKLIDKGYEQLFVRCTAPKLIDFKSEMKPLKETVRINNGQFIVTNQINKQNLWESMQTERISFEIMGVRNAETVNQVHGRIYGEERSDYYFDKRAKSVQIANDKLLMHKESMVVKIGVVSYDMSSLLKNVWNFKEKGQLHNPGALLYKKWTATDRELIDKLTVLDIHLNCSDKIDDSPVDEALWLESGTVLKVEMQLLAPVFLTIQMHRFYGTFKRILVILRDANIAKDLLNCILVHNQKLVGPVVCLLDYMQECMASVENFAEELLTGFFIDNADSYIFFVEGITDSYIQTIYHKIQHTNAYDAKIFYNSDDTFQTRFYNDFVAFGGFYNLVLQLSFQQIFSRQKIFLRGSVPKPCWNAIRKFNLLFKSLTFKSILQYNLLPTAHELISFGIEYGTQLRKRI